MGSSRISSSATTIAGSMQGHYTLIFSTSLGAKSRARQFGLDVQGRLKRRLERPAHFERKFMNRIVKRELKHVPRGEKGSLQNFLRFSYNALRRKHLTLRKTRDETLGELIEKIEKLTPILFHCTTKTTSRYSPSLTPQSSWF